MPRKMAYIKANFHIPQACLYTSELLRSSLVLKYLFHALMPIALLELSHFLFQVKFQNEQIPQVLGQLEV